MKGPGRRVVLTEFGGPEVMRLEEAPIREPGARELLIEVEVAGVNFGDTMIRRGEYLRDQPLAMGPGCEAVGRVVAAGPGATTVPGSRVAAFVEEGGAYADRVIAPEAAAVVVPEDLPAALIAAVFLQGTTAHWAVHRYGRTAPGETVLVHAAGGGVGGIAVQLSKLAGARVVATASSDRKRAAAVRLGADVALDASEPGRLPAAVREATDGRGADVVVDGVGGPLFDPSLEALALNGRYVVAGAASQAPAMLDARHLLVRGQHVCGFMLARVMEIDPSEPGRTLLELCDLLRTGAIDAPVETMPLAEAAEAHRALDERRVTGKIVLAAAGAEEGI